MVMLRNSMVFSAMLCSSFLILSQASYAETVSIGSGDTNTRELGGGTKHSRARAKARRLKRQKRAAAAKAARQHSAVKQAASSRQTSGRKEGNETAQTSFVEKSQAKARAIKAMPAALKPVRKAASVTPHLAMAKQAKAKVTPVVRHHGKRVIAKTNNKRTVEKIAPKVMSKGVMPMIAKSGYKVKTMIKAAPATVKPVNEASVQPRLAVRKQASAVLTKAPIVKNSALPETKMASLSVMTPPLEKPEEAGIQNWPEPKPEEIRPLHPVSEQRAVYENYIQEIKKSKAFRATIERYSSDNKKSTMLRLFNQPKEAQDETIKQIQLSQKCTGLTFIKERQLSPYIVRISYAAKDVCSKYSNNNRYEVVEMIREDDGWKVEKITVTNVID